MALSRCLGAGEAFVLPLPMGIRIVINVKRENLTDRAAATGATYNSRMQRSPTSEH